MTMRREDDKQMTTSNAAGRPLIGRVAGGATALVRAIAGTPAGVSRSRRGTFLVVVIGTLALLAVIAIAHFAIGQSDRRTSNSLERATKIDDVPDQVARYIQGVIARDKVGVVPEETNELMTVGSLDYSVRFLARREANDRPATDWRLLTTDPNIAIVQAGVDLPNRQFFTPEGVGCDPWLADIAPVWMNWEGIAPPTRNQEFRYRRDWGHISNLAPDGRFVNLVNLRNNFTAESGFGVAPGGKPRTSQGLTLLESTNPADPLAAMQTSVRTDFGLSAGAGVTPNLARQRAATWDSRQRGAYRAAKEWTGQLPSDAAYPDNQWADADGDGILDARWFELADARDLDTVKSFLQTDSRMRWFFAARVIDLSGMINLNTATDQQYEPGAAFPIGLNPADIDLKRLLSLQDAYAEWGVGYNALLQPPGAPQAQIPDNYSGMNAQLAKKLGKGSYESIRWSIESGTVPDRYDNPTWDWTGRANAERGVLRQDMWRDAGSSMAGASYDSASRSINLPSQFPVSDMGELLAKFGANNPLENSRAEAAGDGRGGARSGMAGIRESGMGPFRSNRDAAYEANKTGRLQGQGITDTGVTTPEAMLAAAIDVRTQVTTLSGAVPTANMVGNDVIGSGLPHTNEFVLANDERLSLGTKLAADLAVSGVDLFRMYTRSLAPALKLKGVWPQNGVMPGGGGADFQKSRTLFYGHQGPELALLAAGSMAANAEVMLSNDGRLTNPRTLVFSTDYARQLYNSPGAAPKNADAVPASPWFRAGAFCLEPEAEGLPPILAAGAGATIQTPALNLYGFEPQAFITEVGCFTVWRDTPSRFGGDVDMGRIDVNHPNDPPDGFITIRGNIEENNPDLMFRCVVLQLHNPYSDPVQVSTVIDRSGVFRMDDWSSFQYVKIKDAVQQTTMGTAVLVDATIQPDRGMQVAGLTLQPGETVACCLFDLPPNILADRLSNQSLDSVRMFGTQPEAAAFLRNWANKQFVGDRVNRAVFILGVDDPVANITTSFKNYINDPDGSKGMTVQLWKTRRADMTDLGGPNELAAGASNVTGNDQMLDRFRIPVGQTLDGRIKDGPAGSNNGGEDVNGAWGGNEGRPFNPANNYNTGLTIMRWATAARPSDPSAPAGGLPVGAVPAYLLEPQNPPALWHKYHTDHSGVSTATTLTVTKNVVETMSAQNHEAEFVTADWTAAEVNTTVCKSISLAPFKKDTNAVNGDVPPLGQNRAGKAFELVRDVMPRASRVDKGFNGGAAEGVFQAKVPGRTTSTATLRAADLMLPMAISPWESPLKTDLQAQTDPNIRYLTAAEAFAIAYGYDVLPAPSTAANAADPKALYNPTPAAPNNADGNIGDTADRAVMTGGHLVLDDFVPFYDGNQNGRFDRDNAYNGLDYAQVTRKDIRFGLGIPAALNIMDQVTALEEQYGTLRRATPGVVNINTATPTVLRCLPLLTPADRAWGGSNDLIWSNSLEQTKTNIDLAASVLSYRDKRLTLSLPGRTTPAAFDGDGQPPARGFANANGRLFTEIQSGRAMATQMDGIREETGFMSLGELGCVIQRDRDDHGGTGTTRNDPRSIDFLGFNNPDRSGGGLKNDVKGFNSLQFKDIASTAGAIDVDGVRNDFSERLQVLSALSNVASVRSDVYACWFIVRGYTQEDCENLGPDDPMTPSVERRFLMIIDRSNVTSLQKDPKPRVVLFKELPK